MKCNLHTHTARCGHAVGRDEDYVLAAIAAGYDVLGISDHTPFPYENGYRSGSRMQPAQLDDYISSFSSLREQYRIKLYIGLECEAVPRFFPYLREISTKLDYLLLGNHGDESDPNACHACELRTPAGLRAYVDTAIAGLETGLFLYMAHPDIMLHAYPEFDAAARDASRALCRAANALGVPLEYNLLGIEKRKRDPRPLGYPCPDFWRVAAEERVTAVVGVDAHDPAMFAGADVKTAAALLRGMGLRVLENPLSREEA